MGALVYINSAMKIKTMFGIQAAIIGLTKPDTANVALMVINRMYPILSARPIPMFIPIPPFTFRADRDAPIKVNINADMMEANLV